MVGIFIIVDKRKVAHYDILWLDEIIDRIVLIAREFLSDFAIRETITAEITI